MNVLGQRVRVSAALQPKNGALFSAIMHGLLSALHVSKGYSLGNYWIDILNIVTPF